ATANGAGAWTVMSSALTVGDHVLTATATDLAGNVSVAGSSLTVTIHGGDNLPTGAMTITGTPVEGQVLSAVSTLADVDGLGTLSYQWKSDGVDITGANASAFTLTPLQSGHAITVTASYTDGFGAQDASTSALVHASSAPVVDPPVTPPAVVSVAVPGGTVVTGDDQANIIASSGAGAETVSAGGGGDTVGGGSSADVIQGNAGADSIAAGDGADVVYGGQDNDTVQGNTGDDALYGDKGDDQILGGQGGDMIQGGQDNDYVSGDAGDDVLRGGQGDDQVFGGLGNDYLSGDRGNDTLSGGAGADTFHSFAGAGVDVITDFSLAEGDRVRLDPGTTYTLSQVGADTHIVLTGGGEMILANVTLSGLSGDWIGV
ncbi:MAG: hypothetical protein ACXWKR_15805, partial [Phenylobacterium sp.]